MQIARVCGTVVSTQKLPSMTGKKLLMLQLIDREGNELPHYEVAADSVGAGIGEWVLVSRRAIAPDPQGNERPPIDALVVGIIDTVSVEDGLLYSKKGESRYRLGGSR
ncbi:MULTISPECIES: EutN/CcmL family microcompartment protein [unclassified Spirulina]|jgi:carbon dioxide concentrating mechanism protein CcmL|uniref:EutN/CcmL family microcompartment protein n=1 Tax=unclassified Spirulina TaxID=2684457 RepID=UPI001950302D|nr:MULTISPECIES: EutN/CcmL family microcompartment protein [Spirulina]MEA5472270.1 EutN/CcmL family microcompartment protein [Spirulina sp. 06S082]